MAKMDVNIVKMEPMRTAAFHAYGAGPELIAAQKLIDWARPRGLLDGKHRIFGFNNPDPSPGSPNYGYEFWVVLEPGFKADNHVHIKDLPGGLYGVTRCHGVENITPTWQNLAAWRSESRYKPAYHQWLEEHIGPFLASEENMILDLYIPIKE